MSQFSSFFRTDERCVYFPKQPLLFQWPREFAGEKMVQYARKKAKTSIKKILIDQQQIRKYAVVCNLFLKPFSFRTGVLKQNSFCCFSDSSILLWYHFFAKHFWSCFFFFFLNAKMTEYCLNYYINCIPVPICLFPFPWSCCKHAFSAVTGMM